jgi:hypothetical protein
MNKDDWFDLVVKGFSVCFLVLAIIAIPGIVKAMYLAIFLGLSGALTDSNDAMAQYWNVLRSGMVSDGIGSAVKLVIYLFAAVNFLRSGSLVKKFMGRPAAQQSSEAGT